jgi:hypothetical protein
MNPNQDSWTISAQKENLPRLIRLKQINSLLSAFFVPVKAESFIDKAKNLFSFNHKETIQTLITGEFLDRQNISEYSELMKHISTIVGKTKNFNLINEKQIFEYEVNEIKTRDLISPYQELIEYRKYMRKLLKFNAGYLVTP